MNARATIKLAVEALMEVVESSKNIEICVSYPDNKFQMLSEDEVEEFVKLIEKEREEAQQK